MRLKDYLEFMKWNHMTFADKMGVDRQKIRYFLNGSHVPSLSLAVAIEDFTHGAVSCKDLLISTKCLASKREKE